MKPTTVHRIDPCALQTLCGLGAPGHWLATSHAERVTCRACQRVAERRARKAQRRQAGLPPVGNLRPTGVEPE